MRSHHVLGAGLFALGAGLFALGALVVGYAVLGPLVLDVIRFRPRRRG